MSIIIREFRCGDCGATFESTLPVDEVACPTCSAQEAERVFLTPPAIKSPQTGRKDEIQKDLAQTYGFSNMSNRDGAPVARGQRGPVPAQWGSDMQSVVSAIPNQHRDSFSDVGGIFGQPLPTYVGRVK